jgi:hypothetical protein
MFLALLILSEYIFPDTAIISYATVVAGLMTLVSIDMVYTVIPRTSGTNLHSAQVIFTAILYYLILSGAALLTLLLLAGKIILFIYTEQRNNSLFTFLNWIRVVFGLILPVILWLVAFEPLFILGVIWIAELIDRIKFYQQLDIITPKKQIEMDFQKELQGI